MQRTRQQQKAQKILVEETRSMFLELLVYELFLKNIVKGESFNIYSFNSTQFVAYITLYEILKKQFCQSFLEILKHTIFTSYHEVNMELQELFTNV